MQRLAVWVCVSIIEIRSLIYRNRARTFMRSIVSNESTVGLLLFDEPSASLDPSAEHGAYHFLSMWLLISYPLSYFVST